MFPNFFSYKKILSSVLLVICLATTNQAQKNTSINEELERLSDLISEDAEQAFVLLNKIKQQTLSCEERIQLNRKFGVYYQSIRENENALIYYRDSTLSLQKKCLEKSDPSFSNIYFNLGVLYHYRFRDAKNAKHYYDLCLDHLENYSQDANDDSAYYYQFIGSFIRRQGDPGRALHFIQKAKGLYDKNPDPSSIIELHALFALTYEDLGELDKAKEHYLIRNDLISLPKNDKLFNKYANKTNYNIGLIYYKQDSFKRAKIHVEKALDLSKAKKDNKSIFSCLNLLSLIDSKQGNHQIALNKLEQSKIYATSTKDQLFITENKGDFYFRLEQYDDALNQYQKALDMLSPVGVNKEALLSNHFDNSNIGYITRILSLQSKAYYHRKKKGDKMLSFDNLSIIDSLNFKRLNRFWAESSKQKLFENGIKNYQWGLLSALETSDDNTEIGIESKVYALMSRTKAILLREATNQNTTFNTILPDTILQARKELQSQLSKSNSELHKLLKSESFEKIDSLNAAIHDHTRALKKFDISLFSQYPKLVEKQSNKTLSLSEIQSYLDAETLVVEYFCQDDYIFISYISKDRILITKAPSYEAKTYCNPIECSLSDLNNQNLVLYKTLLGDLKDFSAIKNLIIIPDNYLCQIPFESLKQANNRYVLEDYAVSYAYSNNLNNKKAPSLNKKHLVMGSDYSSTQQKENAPTVLPNAPIEAQEISNIIGQEVFLNNQATKSKFLNQIRESKLIHLALHGSLDQENPDQSGIVFDGINRDSNYLSASEVYNLQMNSELTVLSACHSGEGEIKVADAPRSLARSFLVAGSKSVVMSLWQTSDASSEKILIDFYKLLKAGKSKSEALAEAKRNYLANASPTLRHPKYWANLVLIGDDQPIAFKRNSYIYGFLILGLIIFFAVRYSKLNN